MESNIEEFMKAMSKQQLADAAGVSVKTLIVGHHDLNPLKACPCIADVAREYADLNER